MARKAAKKSAKKANSNKPTLQSMAQTVSLLGKRLDLLNGRLNGHQRLLRRRGRPLALTPGHAVMAAAHHAAHDHHFQDEDDVVREVITLLVEDAITSSRADPDEPLAELFDQVRDESASADGFDPLGDFVRDLGAHLGWSPGFMPNHLGKPGLRTAREIGAFAWGER
ncbi:MAG: hypothetical protein K1X78_10225 [Verrucomicrobiaceae bacterium]|nr:hypothetical protein [Verrucomicrobiaceae bacterium]